ncbi:MerR family DNA-binding transcriptional regulator [Streptomyces sp. TRM68367]|uniref:MerR family DNA-binding transcriptional regulator n=1 Tax=Streptomyces sp. TRM68367 TaxID=2758415 RepID=UPI0037DD372D
MVEVNPQPDSGHPRSDPQAGLSIGEAARRTGVSVHTLRYTNVSAWSSPPSTAPTAVDAPLPTRP